MPSICPTRFGTDKYCVWIKSDQQFLRSSLDKFCNGQKDGWTKISEVIPSCHCYFVADDTKINDFETKITFFFDILI